MASLRLRFISDPTHGWAEVPLALCKTLGLGVEFILKGDLAYLEEDAEFLMLEEDVQEKLGMPLDLWECEVDDFDEWLDGPDYPDFPHMAR
jgi:hypothetical protein